MHGAAPLARPPGARPTTPRYPTMTTHDHFGDSTNRDASPLAGGAGSSNGGSGHWGGGSGGGGSWDGGSWDGGSWKKADAEAWFQTSAWSEGLSDQQLALQQDLSCLVDGELDEPAAARAMVLLEESKDARSFFEDIKSFARFQRDLSDPERLEARIAMLGAAEIASAAENIDLAHRLATIFYQLGKAYTIAALEPTEFRERVFEAAVPVHETKTRGRGFVDGVVAGGREAQALTQGPGEEGGSILGGRVDWTEARHLLNGRLEQIADPIEKGKRLLDQAIEIDPSHEESKIYLAFVHAREGRPLRAATLYREVFDTAMSLDNRGHAAMQLGRLHYGEGDYRQALVLWRWMTVSGLVAQEPRFNLAHFNIGVAYAALGKDERAVDSFRRLLDIHLDAGGDPADIATLFIENEDARALFESSPGFVQRLTKRLPELFAAALDGCSDDHADDHFGDSFPVDS